MMYRFSGTVNGVPRSVTFYRAEDDLESAFDVELWVMNHRPSYETFYGGAEDADYDAEIENATAERHGWTEL